MSSFGLEPGQAISNRELMRIFRCACEGGIRPSNSTRTVVLVLNHTKRNHAEDWHGDVLWFQGSGSRGDQELDRGRNHTLLTALEDGRPVCLFEVYAAGKYTFRGPVQLAARPFQQEAQGSDGLARKVWIFPLKLTYKA